MARIELMDVSKTLRDHGSREGGRHSDAASGPAWDEVEHTDEKSFSIRHLDLTVPDGSTMVVLGPSGCGKSTLLRIIAGLLPVDDGRVLYDGEPVDHLSPAERRIGMVFQNYSLYPNMTSGENVRSYFKFRRRTPQMTALEAEKLGRTCELMGVELTHLFDRMPKTLSGGEQQRVAIARCLTRDARVFLVDEPFSNLDQQLRERYRVNLKLLLNEYAVTTVYVTHDQHEAMVLADLIAVMDDGGVAQVGTPQEIYDEPRNAFVAGFLNIYGTGQAISFLAPSDLPGGDVLGDVRVGVRPDEIDLETEPVERAVAGIITSVLEVPPRGNRLLVVRVGSADVQVHGTTFGDVQPGDRVWLRFGRMHLFERGSGRRTRTLSSDAVQPAPPVQGGPRPSSPS